MNRCFHRIVQLLLALVGLGAAQAADLNPLTEFPPATNVTSTVTVADIVHGRQIQRMEVLLDRAVLFGPVNLNAEIAQMLSLLTSTQSKSEPSTSLLALEDHGPTVRVVMSTGQDLIVRRIHNNCYRLYWEGKTAWFRFGKSSNQSGPANGSPPIRSETNSTSSAVGCRR